MELYKETAIFHIPGKEPINEAIERTTHMAIGAHQDDVEIMAYHGIIECYRKEDKWFTAVIVTNGSGSARDNIYKDFTDQEMMDVRRKEQIDAANLGEFSALALLDYSSKEVKDKANEKPTIELAALIKEASPTHIYTHNLADKHDTHIGVVTKVIKAIRLLDMKDRPAHLYGCEVWRDLDWMLDSEKVIFDVSRKPELALQLVNIFESQIIGGKRYDLAAIGRRLSNATFSSSHTVDKSDAVTYAMNLTPLIEDDSLDIITFIKGFIDRLKEDVANKIKNIL